MPVLELLTLIITALHMVHKEHSVPDVIQVKKILLLRRGSFLFVNVFVLFWVVWFGFLN